MGLKRGLRFIDIFCIASGAMISSGLFILPGLAFEKAGTAAVLAYFFVAAMVLPAMLSQAELITAMPKAGADYFFISRSMGPAVGTVGGIISWFSLSLKSAFALVGMGAYAKLVMNIPISLVAVVLCVVFVIVNLLGVKFAGRFQVFLVVGLFILLGIYVIWGLENVDMNRLTPLMPHGLTSVFATAGLVFISYGGLLKVASVAEEVEKPGRNLPLGMITSLIVVAFLYSFVVFVTFGVLDSDKLIGSLTPISDGAAAIFGKAGGIALAVAALFAFVSTANAGILAASRYPMAMSRDRLLPNFLKKTSPRFNTPHFSVLATGAFIIAVVFLQLEVLVKVASTFLILNYMFANIGVIVMRESKVQNYQPQFKSPLYPWLQIAGIVGYGFLIVEMGMIPLLLGGVIIVASVIWYFSYGKMRSTKESALIHLVERITGKELARGSLGKELHDILKERDEIVEDRFDKLVKDAPIFDIDESISMEEFFKMVSHSIAPQLELDEEYLVNLFIQRERDSSTVIRPGLAIPHIIIDGTHIFKIFIARCKKGIIFSETLPPVKIVFGLIGSRDERNFHLRALMATAQITQTAKFDKRWSNARNKDELRDIILLAERERDIAIRATSPEFTAEKPLSQKKPSEDSKKSPQE